MGNDKSGEAKDIPAVEPQQEIDPPITKRTLAVKDDHRVPGRFHALLSLPTHSVCVCRQESGVTA